MTKTEIRQIKAMSTWEVEDLMAGLQQTWKNVRNFGRSSLKRETRANILELEQILDQRRQAEIAMKNSSFNRQQIRINS